MEATLGTLDQYGNGEESRLRDLPRGLASWLSGLFDCTHKDLSRPFSRQGESYRVCIACGAQRRFDAQAWNSRGPFFYKPANTADLLEVKCSALRSVQSVYSSR